MNVDRSRFLLLAAALSANACTIIDNRGKTDASPVDDSANVDTDAALDDAAGDTATADSATGDAGPDATDASDAACTDEGVTVPACAGTSTGGCVLDTLPACTQIPAYFKPGAAKRAIDCLLALPTCEGTTTDPVWACAYSALEGGCPDSTLEGYCAALAASCADPDAGGDAATSIDLRAQCTLYAGGLNAAGRTRLQALVTGEGGCTTPLRDTLQGL